MKREEFELLLKELRNGINSYTDGHSLIEDSDYLCENNIEVQEVEDNIVGHSRWAVDREVIYKIADEFYISVQWDSPATEMQEGQDTNCTVCEVRPIQRLITEFVIID